MSPAPSMSAARSTLIGSPSKRLFISSSSLASSARAPASFALPPLPFDFSHSARRSARWLAILAACSASFSGVACRHCLSMCLRALSFVPAGHMPHSRMPSCHLRVSELRVAEFELAPPDDRGAPAVVVVGGSLRASNLLEKKA